MCVGGGVKTVESARHLQNPGPQYFKLSTRNVQFVLGLLFCCFVVLGLGFFFNFLNLLSHIQQ